MLTAKKVHLILITPALLLALFLAGCLNKNEKNIEKDITTTEFTEKI